jgi:hypothetical protein
MWTSREGKSCAAAHAPSGLRTTCDQARLTVCPRFYGKGETPQTSQVARAPALPILRATLGMRILKSLYGRRFSMTSSSFCSTVMGNPLWRSQRKASVLLDRKLPPMRMAAIDGSSMTILRAL